jgi:nucleoside-diphosphate-sugar epimerase
MERILVTGGTGRLGRVIVKNLIGKHVINVLTRVDISNGMNASVNFVTGDILSRASLYRAMNGCTKIIHAAACVSFNDKDSKKVYETNCIGTKNVIEVAEQTGIKTFINVSSAITRGIVSALDNKADETYTSGDDNAYVQSKILAEQIAHKSRIPNVITVYPTTCFLDTHINEAAKRRILIVPSGGTNIVDSSNVADGIEKCLNLKARHRLILGGHNILFRTLYKKLCELMNIPKRIFVVKKNVSPIVKFFCNNGHAFKTPYIVDTLFMYKYYSSDRAKAVINYIPLPLNQTLERGVKQYESDRIEQGIL